MSIDESLLIDTSPQKVDTDIATLTAAMNSMQLSFALLGNDASVEDVGKASDILDKLSAESILALLELAGSPVITEEQAKKFLESKITEE